MPREGGLTTGELRAFLATRLDDVPHLRPILTICQGGVRSLRAAQFLKQVGYDDVMSVRGGTQAWVDGGLPVSLGDTTLAKPTIRESEWTHAGALSYSI